MDTYTEELLCKFEAEALTTDHNCEVDREKRRIYQNGGRVEKMKLGGGMGHAGPLRVWFRNEDKPGLAMTRSIGDFIASPIGVISTPEISERHDITKIAYPNDLYFAIIIASDGVFDVIGNDRIANICWKNRFSIQKACKEICAEAKEKWMNKNRSVDDIT
jgi:serine/threonine protein phosphatase PrpC